MLEKKKLFNLTGFDETVKSPKKKDVDLVSINSNINNNITRLSEKSSIEHRQELFLIEYERQGFNIMKACEKMNVSFSEYSKWKKTDENFATKLEEIQSRWLEINKEENNELFIIAKSNLRKRLEEGDWNATKFVLGTEIGADKGFSTKVQINGDIRHSFNAEFIYKPIKAND